MRGGRVPGGQETRHEARFALIAPVRPFIRTTFERIGTVHVVESDAFRQSRDFHVPTPPFPIKPDKPAPQVEIGVAEEEEVHAIHVPRYHVVLLDDDDHTYEYVIEMLMTLFGHDLRTAYDMASTVDRAGRVIVDTTTQERARLKRDQIASYGPDWRIPHCTGSMSAEVEPAE